MPAAVPILMPIFIYPGPMLEGTEVGVSDGEIRSVESIAVEVFVVVVGVAVEGISFVEVIAAETEMVETLIVVESASS